MPKGKYLFTSESVSEGHPDKVCDRISDAIVDAFLTADPITEPGKREFFLTGAVDGNVTTHPITVEVLP